MFEESERKTKKMSKKEAEIFRREVRSGEELGSLPGGDSVGGGTRGARGGRLPLPCRRGGQE